MLVAISEFYNFMNNNRIALPDEFVFLAQAIDPKQIGNQSIPYYKYK